MTETVIIGRFGKSHGVKGWIKINSFMEPAANILQYTPWMLNQKNNIAEIKLIQTQQNGNAILALVDGVSTPEQAKLYTNQDILTYRDQLPKLADDEYYWSELENMQVVNQQNVNFGTVDYVVNTGANDILVVKGERERLIPFVQEQYIISVDKDKNIILVDWDEDF